jgi:hypothetical protein
MDTKHSEKTEKTITTNPPPTSSATKVEPDPELPIYYDSEPSSQPPKYDKISSPDKPSTRRSQFAQAHNTGSGAPAATVAALLATPRPEDKEKRSLRQRFKDWIEGDPHTKPTGGDSSGNSAQWNVQDGSIKGYVRR